MSKYDFSLDMNTENSNAVILRHIKPNTRILEVGCAHGRMTKYLREQFNCDVDIIEIDEESGKIAAQWATNSYLGQERGNVENIMQKLDDTYDYIIFADILEHLYDPQLVLIHSKKLLKFGSSIWISIPNIAHNAVLIDLWNNKFIYRDVGLLDNTHIRFFTRSSLATMIYKVDLTVNQRHDLSNTIENTEFKNSYQDIPSSFIEAMKHRQDGEIYQFVWELIL